MSGALYPRDMIRWAAEAHGAGRLAEPQASVRHDNALCGDRVTMDVQLDADGAITALAHETKACVLCQAAASILGEKAIGSDAERLDALQAEITAMLRDGGDPPAPPFGDFAIFESVRPIKSRHVCVRLPVEALIRAVRAALSPA